MFQIKIITNVPDVTHSHAWEVNKEDHVPLSKKIVFAV